MRPRLFGFFYSKVPEKKLGSFLNHHKSSLTYENGYTKEQMAKLFLGEFFLIAMLIKSPKQSLGDLLLLLRFLLLFLFLLLLFLFFSFLSVKHELVHGRSQELQDRIS